SIGRRSSATTHPSRSTRGIACGRSWRSTCSRTAEGGEAMRLVHTINIALALTLIVLSLNAYPDLPDLIPLHFGADGEPDRWGTRSLLSWMLLPLIGVGTVLFLYVTAAVVPRYPKSFNVPDKKKFLELPSHLQQWVMRGILNVMYVLSTTILVTF